MSTSKTMQWIVILNKRSLRSEEPIPSGAEGIWSIRAKDRVLCDPQIARLDRFLYLMNAVPAGFLRELRGRSPPTPRFAMILICERSPHGS